MSAFHRLLLLSALITTVGFSFPLIVTGQPPSLYSSGGERVYIHLDNMVYVSGESIKYKVYLLNGHKQGMAPCSKILYFSLKGPSGNSNAVWRINLTDKPVSGSFEIPSDLKAGMYVLQAFTNLMRNSSYNLAFSQNLLILNLSEAVPDTVMIPAPGISAAEPSPEDASHGYVLRVTTSKYTYSVKETVQVEIDLSSRQEDPVNADLSVSVSAVTPVEELIPETNIFTCLNSAAPGREKTEVPCKYPVEDRGFMLTGRINHRTDQRPLENAKILLSVNDSISPKIRYAVTDSAGEFIFYLNSLFDNKELYLQFGDQFRNADYSWEIDRKEIGTGNGSHSPHILAADEVDILKTVKDLRLIEAVYRVEKTVTGHRSDTGGVNYFNPPNVLVYPGDYADLINFKEIADNILPGVRFIIRGSGYSMQILNSSTGLWNESRIMFLNGVPYTDLAYLATLGTKDIKRIELITSDFLLGDLTLPGLLSLYTHDHNIPENYLKNNTFSFKNTVIPNDTPEDLLPVATPAVPGDHAPDFRRNLLWNPHTGAAGGEKLVVEFPASQLTGRFAIKVRGLTGQGYPLGAETFFEVK